MTIDDNPDYQTSIPEEATPKVKGKHPNKAPTEIDYYVAGELVGRRGFDYSGVIEWEVAFRNGGQHGWAYRWDDGRLMWREPSENGCIHGTASQWDREGNLMGQYTMEHGTGIDLWWQENSETGKYLSEVYYKVAGLRHGYEWHFSEGVLHQEVQWFEGKRHGIERSWNFKDRLRRGYPQYWVNDEQVKRPQYLRALKSDATLPLFRKEDNLPLRDFPPEIQKHL